MNNCIVLLALGLSCLLVAEGIPQGGPLSDLTAAVGSRRRFRYQGPGYGKTTRGYSIRKGRSVEPVSFAEEQDLPIEDPMNFEGCIAKLLCLAQTKNESDRTSEENLLLDTFANNTSPSSSNDFFFEAAKIGERTRDPYACWKSLPKCSLDQEEELDLECDCSEEVLETTEDTVSYEE